MSGSVGGVACDIVRPSSPIAKRTRVGLWIIPGLTGVGAHRLGQNDSQFEFICIEYATSAQINTWAGLIGALQGTVIAITDDHGDSYTGMLVVSVSNPSKIPAWQIQGLGIAGRRGEISIQGVLT
ncbi:hypothetical protein LCGC14_0605910 [marine sediment metagenome]|uniref:Uncharacterized protein n=1 Tax=marine sediment metagenome TaxID=412755 RepID=A0A0F9RDX6_9ZZZZ